MGGNFGGFDGGEFWGGLLALDEWDETARQAVADFLELVVWHGSAAEDGAVVWLHVADGVWDDPDVPLGVSKSFALAEKLDLLNRGRVWRPGDVELLAEVVLVEEGESMEIGLLPDFELDSGDDVAGCVCRAWRRASLALSPLAMFRV